VLAVAWCNAVVIWFRCKFCNSTVTILGCITDKMRTVTDAHVKFKGPCRGCADAPADARPGRVA
jgi:hypothetical protein